MKKCCKLLVGLWLVLNVGLAYAECGIYENTATIPAHTKHHRVDWGNNGNHSNTFIGAHITYLEYACNGPGSLTDWVPIILVENTSQPSDPTPDVTVSSYLNNGFGGYWLMDSANLANQDDSHYEDDFNDFILYNSHQTGTSYYYVLYADNNTDKDVSIHYTVCNYYPKTQSYGIQAYWGCGRKGDRPI